jgi:hypothetical protein
VSGTTTPTVMLTIALTFPLRHGLTMSGLLAYRRHPARPLRVALTADTISIAVM